METRWRGHALTAPRTVVWSWSRPETSAAEIRTSSLTTKTTTTTSKTTKMK
uniref:Uncharacterized protein n=1 Tax=Anguilla anguilla TaxID=7936 RepID=A0A0E9U8U8_ANGAN